MLGQACAADAPPPAAQDPRDAPVKAAWAEVLREVGTPTCQTDTQCRVADVGARPCGGPDSFIAWSTAVTSEGQLMEKLAGHKKAREQRQRQDGILSDCRVLPRPTAICTRAPGAASGVCALGRGGAARSD